MPLDPDRLLSLKIAERHVSYTVRDTLLYSLSLGAGLAGDLRLVHEDGLRVIPSFGQNLAFGDAWMADCGIDLATVVHGGLDLAFGAPFAPSGGCDIDARIIGLGDKGAGKAATVLLETTVAQAGAQVLTSRSTLFVRGAGGFGGSRGTETELIRVPERPADERVEVTTRPDQALFFRLLGDFNPLHALPDKARAAGFDGPIMHGAATFGIACLTILQRYCASDPRRMQRFAARFSGPLYPGETLQFSIWGSEGRISFAASAKERGKPVLDGGLAEIRG